MIYRILLSSLVFSLLFSCAVQKNQRTGNVPKIYYNGDIITMHTQEPTYVEAVVEVHGKIAFVGDLNTVLNRYKDHNLIDLKGKTMLPGFIDPHSHFGMVSNSMGQVDLNPSPVGNVSTIEDIQLALVRYKKDHNIPDGDWIFGWGYDDGQLAEKRHLNKNEIDAVLPNNPVYLQHTSGHMGVANSMALNKLSVNASTPNPEGGNIARIKGSNEPNGLVQETAMYPFVGNMLEVLAKDQEKYFEQTQDFYAQNGITTAQDGMTDRPTIHFFQSQANQGKLKLDLIALAGFSDLSENIKDEDLRFKTYKNGFKVQGTKIIADGSPQGKTAYFTQSYLTEVPDCDSNCKGLPSISQNNLNNLFKTAYEHDNQLFIHCNGDASIDMVIEAHEYACKTLNQPLDKDRRTIAIHAQFVRPDQLEIFKKYKIEPSFFTNHAFFWGDNHVENLGVIRANFLSPIHSADKLGLKYTNHSDATVTPINPVFTVWSAVNRVSRSGKTIGEGEKVSPYLALKAITSHAAYEFYEENYKGTLEQGKIADFVILDKNPLKVNPMDIKNIEVVETIKNGKPIYQKK
ncbi:amidohydrolase family protein [Flavobacteriaceae bacterium Ap0902]|nr:amidohydrolase family protein [Flavobacteriaceae bacterium Ap0902]